MRVLLCMPRYDSRCQLAAAMSFCFPSNPDNSKVQLVHSSAAGSLLTGCFNSCWAAARNEWEAGNADGFAMIHSDIGVQPGWLDVLHDELDRTGADIIGVSIPIKDPRWLHSTGVETGDPWRVRRLTSAEVMSLPETFTEDDVPGLLLNTGLWLCKLGRWCLQTHFHVEDRIVRGADGRWVAGTIPEDWGFSRQCRALGLRLACTRKVVAEHYGEFKWNNQQAAGWHTDLQNADALAGWAFPRDVDGWLTDEEARELALTAAGQDVLEIGSYQGLSSISMAQTARSLTCVDPFDGRGCVTPACDFYPGFVANVARYGLTSKVRALRGTSADIVPRLRDEQKRYGLAFIDGAHDYQSVLRDAGLARTVLVPGGLLAFHDYHSPRDPEVTPAVDALIQSGTCRLLRTVGTVAIVEPVMGA